MGNFGDNETVKRIKRIKKNNSLIKTNKTKLPDDDKIAELAKVLIEQAKNDKIKINLAPVKLILSIIGTGVLLTANFVAPGTIKIWETIINEGEKAEKEKWKKFNPYYLKRTLQRLEKQKLVEVIEGKDNEKIIKISGNGKKKILKYSLDRLQIIPPKKWDNKWRIVIWDIPCDSNYLRTIFRNTLENLGFLRIQKSTFIYLYPCFDKITFLREYYALGDSVLYLVAEEIENDKSYREYFGLH